MNRQRLMELFVINAMSDDYELLDQIEQYLARDTSDCGISFSAPEVVETLRALIKSGFVKAYYFAAKPREEIKKSQQRGVVTELDNENKIVKIQDHKFAAWYEPETFEYRVKDPSVFAKLKLGEKVRATIFYQYSGHGVGDVHEDDGKGHPRSETFHNVIEVPGVPDDEHIRDLLYGLSPTGRAVQDSEEPDWPLDGRDLRPGWTLDDCWKRGGSVSLTAVVDLNDHDRSRLIQAEKDPPLSDAQPVPALEYTFQRLDIAPTVGRQRFECVDNPCGVGAIHMGEFALGGGLINRVAVSQTELLF